VAKDQTFKLYIVSVFVSPWEKVIDHAAFTPRDGAGELVFDGKMWLFGGYPSSASNEVWSSTNGRDWMLVNPKAAWPGRHSAGYVVYDNRMWIMSGDGIPDVWYSSDGINWTLATDNPPWGRRYKPIVFVFRDKIWLMGGWIYWDQNGNIIENDVGFNDIWSSTDGIHWNLESQHAAWQPRGIIHGSVVFDGKVWILGGGLYGWTNMQKDYSADVYYNDVWSSPDGIHWTQVLEHAPWIPRQHHNVAVYDNKMWVLAGHNYQVDPVNTLRNDVWYSSDGRNWQELRGALWSPRHAASVFVYNNSLWIVAGYLVNDVWKYTNHTIYLPVTRLADPQVH